MSHLTSTAFAAIAVQLGSSALANAPAAHTDTAYMDSLVLEYPLPMNATHTETSPFIWISLIVLVAIGIYLACKIKRHRRLAQAQEETQTRQITMLLQREQTFHEQEQVLLKEKEEMTEHLNHAHKERQRLFHSLLEKSKPYQQVLLLLKEHNDGLNANELLSAELWQELTDCINQCSPRLQPTLTQTVPTARPERHPFLSTRQSRIQIHRDSLPAGTHPKHDVQKTSTDYRTHGQIHVSRTIRSIYSGSLKETIQGRKAEITQHLLNHRTYIFGYQPITCS